MWAACSGCPFLFFPSHPLDLYQYYDLDLVSIATIQSLGWGPHSLLSLWISENCASKSLFVFLSHTYIMRKKYETVTLTLSTRSVRKSQLLLWEEGGKTGEEIQNCVITGQRVPNESSFRHIGTQTFNSFARLIFSLFLLNCRKSPILRRRDGSSSFLSLAFEEISIDSGPLCWGKSKWNFCPRAFLRLSPVKLIILFRSSSVGVTL